MKEEKSAFLIGMLLSLTVINCGKKPETSTATVDPWMAPAGTAILGATLGDGWQDLRELPDPVAVSGGWTDSVAISPDGLSLYFGYAKYDFGDFMDTAAFNPTGPSRTGMAGDNFKIFRADLGVNGWTVNYHPVNGSPNIDEASASPNATGNLIVFSRFTAGVGRLYYSSLTSGSWSAPTAYPSSPVINTPASSCTNDNGFITGDLSAGYTLYFESNRLELAGTSACTNANKNRLYFTTFTPGIGFSAVALVPGLYSGLANEDDTQISLSQDKLQVFFTRATNAAYGIFTGDLISGAYSNIRQIVTPNFASPYIGRLGLVGEANLAETSSGKLLYMLCGIGTAEGANHAPRSVPCFARKPK